MKEIEAEVAVCVKCRLWKTRKHAVPGNGDINTKMIFVGEAPGRQEDLKGLPFVGAAGRLFNKLLDKLQFSRNDVYITNIVKCRPPRNRDPRPDEIATCTDLFLGRQVSIIRPRLLVTLGRHSTGHFLSKAGIKAGGITKIHGNVYHINPYGFPIVAIPTLHPAAALYNGEYRGYLEEDFEVLKAELEKPSS